ncbi:hypothetical protein M5689_006934 [Euphorbia peplus]|nr:hypothetical protein M5689_006934 [Euphorbia peplus]
MAFNPYIFYNSNAVPPPHHHRCSCCNDFTFTHSRRSLFKYHLALLPNHSIEICTHVPLIICARARIFCLNPDVPIPFENVLGLTPEENFAWNNLNPDLNVPEQMVAFVHAMGNGLNGFPHPNNLQEIQNQMLDAQGHQEPHQEPHQGPHPPPPLNATILLCNEIRAYYTQMLNNLFMVESFLIANPHVGGQPGFFQLLNHIRNSCVILSHQFKSDLETGYCMLDLGFRGFRIVVMRFLRFHWNGWALTVQSHRSIEKREKKVAMVSHIQIVQSKSLDRCFPRCSSEILKNMRPLELNLMLLHIQQLSRFVRLAFSLFTEMKRCQIKPNLVNYDTWLRARVKYGSLEEVQHCLGRAGYCWRTDLGKQHSLLLEKVAAHLWNSTAKNPTRLDQDDWLSLGDGKGKVTIVRFIDNVRAPDMDFTCTWSAEKERELLGTYWCMALTYRLELMVVYAILIMKKIKELWSL